MLDDFIREITNLECENSRLETQLKKQKEINKKAVEYIKEELKEIEDIIKDSDYKNHYHLHTYFEVEHIDNLVRAYKKQKEIINNAINFINTPWGFESGNKEFDEIEHQKKLELLQILENKGEYIYGKR